ncbi:MAG: DNA-3-methyladenine glycosylase [Ardenticatenaceae bacterium]|nr:DNA-3-methyladenine glycosylase [Ardenticatenaceae bacterium]
MGERERPSSADFESPVSIPTPLPRSFYSRPTLAVARDLLGAVLVRRLPDGTDLRGRIVETEAYVGPEDSASHAHRGRNTQRTAVMFGPAGVAYIYFTYGMHHMLNVVTEDEGFPAAVLIRALEPLDGIELMRARRGDRPVRELTNGPAKLCQAMDIDRSLNGHDLTLGPPLWIAPGAPIPDSAVARTPRVGIGYAEAPDREALWRFLVRSYRCRMCERDTLAHATHPIPYERSRSRKWMDISMKVEILFGEQGARDATRRQAVTVVIDALRASATVTTALALGAREVIPVSSVEEARCYLGRRGHRVAGERNSARIPDFDYGNSPTELCRRRREVVGRTLVLTTSNGTRIVNVARDGAVALLLGTTLNAGAVARAAFELSQTLDDREIVLLAAGEEEIHAEEDYVGARTIARHLCHLGATVQPADLCEETPEAIFANTPSGRHLHALGYAEDVLFCARCDLYPVVPWFDSGRFVLYKPGYDVVA